MILESEETEEEEIIAEPGGVELAKPEKPEEEAGAAEESVEAEVGLYHPVVPELLDAFTEAVEILEALAEGRLRPGEAKAIYLEKVKAPVEAVAIDTTEKEKRKRKATQRRRRKAARKK